IGYVGGLRWCTVVTNHPTRGYRKPIMCSFNTAPTAFAKSWCPASHRQGTQQIRGEEHHWSGCTASKCSNSTVQQSVLGGTIYRIVITGQLFCCFDHGRCSTERIIIVGEHHA